MSLVDINESDFTFKPDIKNNEILFGMKAINKVGGDVIEKIIAGRPYKSITDFMNRCPLNITVMVSLIKAGAFDKLDSGWASKINKEPRIAILGYYLSKIYGKKTKINLQNFAGLIKNNLLPKELINEQGIFEFNRYLKLFKNGEYYLLDNRAENFYSKHFPMDALVLGDNNQLMIKQKIWEKLYKKGMDPAREYLNKHQEEMLNLVNRLAFIEVWKKYAGDGNISAWEMESLCFYYHEHELENIDKKRYGIVDFSDLPTFDVNYYIKRNGREIPIYNINKIVGTVIAKNDTRHTVSLLTTTGVVPVKFTSEYYSIYKKQISNYGEDGKKHVVEKSWFTRGTKLLIQGYRRDDQFVAKTYSSTTGHQLYRIDKIHNTEIVIRHERAGGFEEDIDIF